MTLLHLTSSDRKHFLVDKQVMKYSKTITNMLENLDENDEMEEIPLLNVDSETLQIIIYWSTYYQDGLGLGGSPKYNEKSKTFKADFWDYELFNVEGPVLLKIVEAADYLEIQPLIDIGCDVLAKAIAERDRKEVLSFFKWTDD